MTDLTFAAPSDDTPSCQLAALDGPWIGDVTDRVPPAGALLVAQSTRCAAWNATLPAVVASVESGRLDARIDQTSLRLRAGDLLIAPRSVRTSLLLDPDTDGAPPRLIALAHPQLEAPEVAVFSATGPIPLVDVDLVAGLHRLLNASRAPAGPSEAQQAGRAMIADLRSQAARLQERARGCPGRTIHSRLAMLGRLLRARHTIDASLGAEHGLARLAADAGLSKWHFLRVYRELFGETPYQLAARRRFDAAQHLLRKTRLPIVAVARVLHFRDASSLSSFVRRHAGLSPSALRRSAPVAAPVARELHRFPRSIVADALGASTA